MANMKIRYYQEFTLTPRTEAKYNKIDEEFHLMMQRNQVNGVRVNMTMNDNDDDVDDDEDDDDDDVLFDDAEEPSQWGPSDDDDVVMRMMNDDDATIIIGMSQTCKNCEPQKHVCAEIWVINLRGWDSWFSWNISHLFCGKILQL